MLHENTAQFLFLLCRCNMQGSCLKLMIYAVGALHNACRMCPAYNILLLSEYIHQYDIPLQFTAKKRKFLQLYSFNRPQGQFSLVVTMSVCMLSPLHAFISRPLFGLTLCLQTSPLKKKNAEHQAGSDRMRLVTTHEELNSLWLLWQFGQFMNLSQGKVKRGRICYHID